MKGKVEVGEKWDWQWNLFVMTTCFSTFSGSDSEAKWAKPNRVLLNKWIRASCQDRPPSPPDRQSLNKSSAAAAARQTDKYGVKMLLSAKTEQRETHGEQRSSRCHITISTLGFFFFNLEPPARCGIIILLAGKLTAWIRQDRLAWAAGPGSALPRC